MKATSSSREVPENAARALSRCMVCERPLWPSQEAWGFECKEIYHQLTDGILTPDRQLRLVPALAEFSADDPCFQLRESVGYNSLLFQVCSPTMNWTRPLELFLEVALGIWLLDKILKAVKEKSRS